MSKLPVYDEYTFSEDQMNLSLSEGGKKYSDWQARENGANTFACLTLGIAMRDFLTRVMSVPRDSLTSFQEVTGRYYAVETRNPLNHVQPTWEWKRSERDLSLLPELKRSVFRYTIGSDLREFAVRHHACGLTTAAVISLVFDAPEDKGLTPLWNYVHYFPVMKQACRDYLSTQLNYLKVGHPRFPKKYLDLWQTARAEHIQHIQHIPLTHISEQIAAMQQHYAKLLDAFDALPPDAEYTRERERLTNAMTKTMSGLYALTRDPSLPKPSQDALGQTESLTPLAAPVSVDALPGTGDETVSDAQTPDTENVDA